MRDDNLITTESTDFYLTDQISDNAIRMIGENAAKEKPFSSTFPIPPRTGPCTPSKRMSPGIRAPIGKGGTG
jgi:hypothetical protein